MHAEEILSYAASIAGVMPPENAEILWEIVKSDVLNYLKRDFLPKELYLTCAKILAYVYKNGIIGANSAVQQVSEGDVSVSYVTAVPVEALQKYAAELQPFRKFCRKREMSE